MARDIHDTLAQGFTGVIVQLEAAEEAMSQNLAVKASGYLDRAGELARESLREARRSLRALRPQALEKKDLCDALEGLIQKMTEGTTVRAEFILQGEPREIPPEWEENLLRIGQEVLTNALRHAQASKFNVKLVFDNREIRLNLRDNGRGFDLASRHDGFGLQPPGQDGAFPSSAKLTVRAAQPSRFSRGWHGSRYSYRADLGLTKRSRQRNRATRWTPLSPIGYRRTKLASQLSVHAS
jgi:nitrate/nitrite-specific signal transduction histidine kinase